MINWRQLGLIRAHNTIGDEGVDGAGAQAGIEGEIVPVAGTETETVSTDTGDIARSAMNALIATGATGIGRGPTRETRIAGEDGHAHGLETGTERATITEKKTTGAHIHAKGTQTIIGAKRMLSGYIFASLGVGRLQERK